MSKKQRLEDLGKIAEKLDQLRNEPLFDLYNGAPKRFQEWWSTKDAIQKDEFLHKVAYGIEDVYMKLCEICCIADGDDE